MMTDDIQETFKNQDWWGVTMRAVGPSWTATSWARACHDRSCDSSLPRVLCCSVQSMPYVVPYVFA